VIIGSIRATRQRDTERGLGERQRDNDIDKRGWKQVQGRNSDGTTRRRLEKTWEGTRTGHGEDR
jgi:hypothetical protein